MKWTMALAIIVLGLPASCALAQVTTSPSDAQDKMAPLVQAVQQAADPSAVVSAYANGFAVDRTSVALHEAYVTRMVQLGLPELAFRQAQLLTTLNAGSGIGWGVIAYVQAKQGAMPEALAALILAAGRLPNDPFVQSTAGQLLAWLDSKPRPEIPDAVKADLEKIRLAMKDKQPYLDSYNQAKTALAATAQAEPPQPTYVPPTQAPPAPGAGTTPYAPGTDAMGPTYNYNYYYDSYPRFADYGPYDYWPSWWWWRPSGFFHGSFFFHRPAVFVVVKHRPFNSVCIGNSGAFTTFGQANGLVVAGRLGGGGAVVASSVGGTAAVTPIFSSGRSGPRQGASALRAGDSGRLNGVVLGRSGSSGRGGGGGELRISGLAGNRGGSSGPGGGGQTLAAPRGSLSMSGSGGSSRVTVIPRSSNSGPGGGSMSFAPSRSLGGGRIDAGRSGGGFRGESAFRSGGSFRGGSAIRSGGGFRGGGGGGHGGGGRGGGRH